MIEKQNPRLSLKDGIMIAGALGAVLFHAGTFYAVKDKVEKHEKDIESIKQENNRQQIEIEILNVKLAKRETRGH